MPRELPKAYEPGAIESRWAEYWVREKLFHVETPSPGDKRPVFTLLLPPPNVTGRLHMGHMLNQTQMDIVVRWHRMRGNVALWLPGTDHAGIATQMMVERQLAKEGKNRRAMGREKFIERVWEWRREYGGAILDQMKRLGASVDWGREYFTMDDNLSRAVKEVFVRLYEDGLIYRGKYIVNWCSDCGTAISDLEVKHEDVPGKLYEIRYPVINGKADGKAGSQEFITVATTRPETMLGDTAVAVNPTDERYTHLHGKRVLLPLMNREIPIIADELAQPEFGTGAVKVTPAHDPNDFEAGLRHNLPQIEVIDEHSKMNANAGSYAGLDRFAARARIVEDLAAQGFLVGTKDYTIAIGKCDRSGTIVEPRLSTQWFVKIAPLAKRAIEVVEKGYIRFTPENYGQIYLNWMRNIHDWCISRQLWWGHRIPAWYCREKDCNEVVVAREAPAACKCGSTNLEQDTDVLDTWFSSGLLPFTTLGWPEATRDLEVFYPNSLMITGFDILFFWVARMIMLGCWFMMPPHKRGPHPSAHFAEGWAKRSSNKDTSDVSEEALQASVPFREVYIHALVRDADRQKMSKTKGNVLDPIEVINQYGTDATRFTLAAMAAPGTDIAFSESRTAGYRNFANKIWNAARFMFMNVDRVAPAMRPNPTEFFRLWNVQAPRAARPLEDDWILARFNATVRDINAELGAYRFDRAASCCYDFFWGDLCDWFLEMIKPRLASTNAVSSQNAAEILSNIFELSLRLLHPFMPFITEEIWQAMYEGVPHAKSIALVEYPSDKHTVDDWERNALLSMAILQDLLASIRNMRAELRVEAREKVSVEILTHDLGTAALFSSASVAIDQILDRLANVEGFTLATSALTGACAATRTTARFDVGLHYQKKIDVAAERERLTKELEKIEKEQANGQRQLSNEQFLAKAPAKVVEGLKTRAEELKVLQEKARAKLKELAEIA
jgi:valyl-tRNA synthetase